MAKMLGKLAYSYQRDDNDPLPKSRITNAEDRLWKKEAEDEELIAGECPHVTSVREDIAGLKACHECWCLQRGLNPYTTPDYRIEEING